MNTFRESEVREKPIGKRKFSQGVSDGVPSHQWDAQSLRPARCALNSSITTV
jgi:hypothetical protein